MQVMIRCIFFLDFSFPTEIVEKIRQLYETREQRLLPVPWCEDFSFHLNEIFTRLKIVSKEKIRGVLTDDITDMTAIFKPHVECQRPRTVLIEGDPGMGKSTYILFEKESYILKNTNLEVPLLLYRSLDFFHSRLVAARGKLLCVMHFSTKASKSSFLDFILLAKFLTEVLTVSQ